MTAQGQSRGLAMRRVGRVLLLACLGVGVGAGPAGPALAQNLDGQFDQQLGQVVSPILLLDRERLFSDSAYGKRISAQLEAERQRQEARTRAIEEELKAEELALTRERANLSVEEFRARADAFDAKVESLRAERDRAQADLVAQIEQARARFLQQISPVLAAILRESGAVIMLDKRVALLASRQIDVTDQAIARIDAALAESDALELPSLPQAGENAGAGTDMAPAPDMGAPEQTRDQNPDQQQGGGG